MVKFNVWSVLLLMLISSACTQQQPENLPQITSFKANPAIIQNATSVNLVWQTTGAISLSIDPGVGVVNGNSKSVNVATTTTFTLTAKNSSGTVSAKTTVTHKAAPFSYSIDPALKPHQDTIVGKDGPRPVATVIDARGKQSDFVANEAIVLPKGQSQLDAFLSKYQGKVVSEYNREGIRTVLVQLNPMDFSLDNFTQDANKIGVPGQNKFSSDQGAKLLALVIHEQAAGLTVAANFLDTAHAVLFFTREQSGANAFTRAEFNNPGNKPNVTQAWQYMAAHALKGGNTLVRVAIIDGGFWLNPGGSSPTDNNGQADFPAAPLQYDFVDDDADAGGPNPMTCKGGGCPWHGTGSASVAVGTLNNGAFAAGTGGQVADPILMKADGGVYQVKHAIDRAIALGADVINMSFGGSCNWFCKRGKDIAGYYDAFERAHNAGIFLVASASNEGEDSTEEDIEPCKIGNVFCVGALGTLDAGNNPIYSNVAFTSAQWSSNYGSTVNIWAPTYIQALYATTPPPLGLSNFNGTSASAPYISGIAAMMRAVNPNLSPDQMRGILLDTAWKDSPDPKVGHYVNALGAVKLASNYLLPTDGFEPNNNPASATFLNPGQHNGLNLHNASDSDFFRISAAGPTLATLDIAYPSGLGKVFLPPYGRESTQSCGGYEQVSYDTTQTDKIQAVYRLSSGNFFFSISGNPNPIPYDLQLQLSAKPIAPDSYEPNDTLAQKRDLGDGGYVQATLHNPSDVDFFEFNSRGNFNTMVLSMKSGVEVQSSDNPLTIEVFDDTGACLKHSNGSCVKVTSSADCRTQAKLRVPQGRWIVKVSGNAPGAYWLRMGSDGEQHPVVDISVIIYLILHPNVPVEFVVKDKEAWFVVEKQSDYGIKGLNLHTPGLHLSLYTETGNLIAEGKPNDLRGSQGEALTVPEALSSSPYYLVRLTRALEGATVAHGQELPTIPASLEMVAAGAGPR